MLREEPQVVRDLLERIARATAEYLKAQIAAGAAVVQLFDTWAGELSTGRIRRVRAACDADDFAGAQRTRVCRRFCSRKARRGILESMAQSGADVLSVDWNTDLAEARRKLGRRVALQGNVDPSILLGPEEEIRRAAREAIEKTGGAGHILNLGHGILPNTPVENARAFVRSGKSSDGGGAAMSDVKTRTRRQDRDRRSLRRVSGEIQSARPALHELPDRAGVEGRFRPGRPREVYSRAEELAHAAVALHASSLLREPVPVLRVQRRDHKGQQRRDPPISTR